MIATLKIMSLFELPPERAFLDAERLWLLVEPPEAAAWEPPDASAAARLCRRDRLLLDGIRSSLRLLCWKL
jgi:hypothetical protein